VLRYFCEYVIVFTDGTGLYIGAADHDMFDTQVLSTERVELFRLKSAGAGEYSDPDGQLI